MKALAVVLTCYSTIAFAEIPVAVATRLDSCLSWSPDQLTDMNCMNAAFNACGFDNGPCLTGLNTHVNAAAETLAQQINMPSVEAPTQLDALRQRMFRRRLDRVSEPVERDCSPEHTADTCDLLNASVRLMELRSLSREMTR